MQPCFLTSQQYNKVNNIIKQETTTLNVYNTHRRTHPANLQHKAIQSRALMDSIVTVKGEFTINTKAQRTGGATLQTYQLRLRQHTYYTQRRGNILWPFLRGGGGERQYFLGVNKGSSPVGRLEVLLTSIAPLIPKYTFQAVACSFTSFLKVHTIKCSLSLQTQSLHFNVTQFQSIIPPLVHYQTTSMQLPKLQKDSIYTMNTFCLKYSMYIFPLHMDTVSSPTFHYAAG